jgi:hypothetical protein
MGSVLERRTARRCDQSRFTGGRCGLTNRIEQLETSGVIRQIPTALFVVEGAVVLAPLLTERSSSKAAVLGWAVGEVIEEVVLSFAVLVCVVEQDQGVDALVDVTLPVRHNNRRFRDLVIAKTPAAFADAHGLSECFRDTELIQVRRCTWLRIDLFELVVVLEPVSTVSPATEAALVETFDLTTELRRTKRGPRRHANGVR